jgi:hypothetical protein
VGEVIEVDTSTGVGHANDRGVRSSAHNQQRLTWLAI